VIVIAVVVALVLRGGRGKAVTGGEDTDFPYVWTVNKNGTIAMEIDRAAAPGYLWTSGSVSQMEVAVSQDASESKTRFTLTPKEQGRCVLAFRLQREDDPEDCIFEITALTDTAFDGKTLTASFLNISGRSLPGVTHGGEGTLCPYMLRLDEDGDMMVIVADMEPAADDEEEEEVIEDAGQEKKPEGWQCETGDEAIVEYLGLVESEEYKVFYLRAGTTAGRTRVRIWKVETGTELTIEFELSEDGTLLPVEHSIRMGSVSADTEG
jgi:hypothetical protein